MVVVHERYGLVRHTRELAERFAHATVMLAIARRPLLQTPGPGRAPRGDANCDVSDPDAVIALGAAIDAFAGHPAGRHGPAGDHGHLSDRPAAAGGRGVPPVAAALVWYGAAQPANGRSMAKYPRPLDEIVAAVDCPVLGMFGETDHLISIEDIRRLRDCLERHGKSYDIHVYRDAPHGWLNDTMPGRYRRAQAEAAWAHQRAFLEQVLAPGYDRSMHATLYADLAVDYDFSRNVRHE